MTSGWESVVRFEAEDGAVYWSPLPLADSYQSLSRVRGYENIEDIQMGNGGREVTVKKFLPPIPDFSIPIVCVGLNYRNHAEEAKLTVPDHPSMWYKPPSAVASPDEDVPIPKQAWENFLDFEGELTVVTSKIAKDVSESEAASYILGYTIGNDLTARAFQSPTKNGGQFTYAKAFDNFAPMGPRLVSAKLFGSHSDKTIESKVNGRIFQSSPIDLVYDACRIISFLSQGTTLPAGTAIMTGTPGGVGWFQDPQYNLKDGDVVEIEVKPIGILKNKVSYVK